LSRLRSWSEHDYTLAVALQQYEDDLCGSCGHPMSETAKNIYSVPEPSRCGACDALQMTDEQGTYKQLPRPEALRFSTTLIPRETLKPRPWEQKSDAEQVE
jgi:hypothetical protein